MQIKRTTIRLDHQLEKEVKKTSLEIGLSFQEMVNLALKDYIKKTKTNKIKRIIFETKEMGVNLDNLTRDDIYAD